MTAILCAVRGGPDSGSTIEKAIAVAEAEEATIYFLYVVNVDYLTRTSTSRVAPIVEDMRQMGEFILLQAQQAATDRGVTSYRIIQQGHVREEILALCADLKPRYVILGRPLLRQEHDTFTLQALQTLIEQIAAACGAETLLVNGSDA